MSTAARFSRGLFSALIHTLVVAASFWFALLLRFDFSPPQVDRPMFLRALLLAEIAKVLVFVLIGSHRQRWWRHQGLPDLLRLFGENVLASLVAGVAIYTTIGAEFPRSVYMLDLLVCFLITGLGMFAKRIYFELKAVLLHRKDAKGLVIYGGGVAGIALAREIRDNPKLGYKVIGFLDDDPQKSGHEVLGLKVLGTGKQAEAIVQNSKTTSRPVDEIVVAMPSATGGQIRAAVELGKAAGVHCRIVPGLGELISGKPHFGPAREIAVTDILGRDPVELDLDSVRKAIQGRSVMVTGAAGSIGSELCHQIASFEPLRLVTFDQAETELFRLEADLRAKFPNVNLVIEVGDIRDAAHVEHAIEYNAINSIFHAAAYKHVPMMERQVCEAVRNNVIGTWNVAQAAWRANVSNFLLISTDKAVNPTSIMGLTKRVTELLVSAERSTIGHGPPTKFVAVRFGNVLVSNGSVVPTFEKQIAAGGPVTVTHPDMQRYFMTVREASQLVLQASTMGRGSEIFVLDMGTPVKITDLATRMITLAGFIPGEDIEIRYTGLRPGEKLFEELALAGEDIVQTSHPGIRIFKGQHLTLNEVLPWIAELQHLVWRRDPDAVVDHLRMLVPEYQPGNATGAPMSPVGAKSPVGAAKPALIPATNKSLAG